IKLRAVFLDGNDAAVEDMDIKTLDIPGTADWNEQSYTINVPNNTNIKKIIIQYLYDNCKGSLWLDDIDGELSNKTVSNNMVKNGDFEEGVSYWDVYIDKGTFKLDVDKSIKKDGNKSIKIYNNTQAPSRGILTQVINLPSQMTNKTLNVTQWVKTDKLLGSGLEIRASFINSSGQIIEEKYYNHLGVSSTNDWSQLKYNIILPEYNDIKALQLQYIYDNCIGTVWFDRIDIEESESNQNKNLLQNSGFEATISNIVDVWSISKISGNQTVDIDKSLKVEGNNSLKFTSDKSNTISEIDQYINLPSNLIGKSIKTSQWIKTDDYKAQTFLVTIKYFDSNGSEISKYTVKNYYDIPRNSSWMLLQNSVDIPNDKNIKSLVVYDDIKEWSGSIWIDNFSVEPYTKIINIGINPSIISLNRGETKNFDINVSPSNATHKDLGIVSLDENVATIGSLNQIKGIKNGVTKIEINQNYQGIKLDVPVIVGKSNSIFVNQNTNLITQQDKILNGKVDGKSVVNSKLQYSVFIDPRNGFININSDGLFSYYPNKGFSGNDTFTILIKDSNDGMALAQYNINVQKSTELPIIDNFIVTLKQGDSYASGKLQLNNQSLSGVNLLVSKNTENGSFTIDSYGSYKYTPKINYTGYDAVEIMEKNSSGLSNIIHGTVYVAPSVQNIKQSLINQHPRIIANKSDFDRIKLLVKIDSNAIVWFNKLKQKTDVLLSQPVVKYEKKSESILVTTSTSYIEQLSFMYRITGDKKYAYRAWLELENICKQYPDWNDDGQFLDATVMASGAAIGYDWLYDYLDESQKTIIETAINKNTLNLALNKYVNGNEFFVNNNMNWNIVCNSNIIMATLAIYDKVSNPEEIIQHGLKSIQSSLNTYYTDGGGIEGAGYWSFATQYLINLQASLNTSLSYKNYFNSILDFQQMANYQKYITGNEGEFNYSDNNETWSPAYFGLWFAKQLNNASLIQYFKFYKTKSDEVNINDLLWYDPILYKDSYSNNTNLDMYFPSTQIVTMRSTFDNNLGTFIGLKGGLSGAPHGHLDIGSFVYDTLGIRWAVDLGAENYGVNGYFDDEINGDRWNYYRTRAEGQNTLVIGSSNHEDQVLASTSKVIKSNLNCSEPYAVLDMTPSYSDKAINVQREIRLLNNRKDMLITDDFLLKQEQDVTWQMHTQANTTVVDGGKGVILTQDGKKVYLKLLSGDNGMMFEVVDAVPSSASPNPQGQTNNIGIKKIIIKTKTKIGTIKVQITPIEDQSSYISNGSFEDGNSYWYQWSSSGDFKASTDTVVKKSGTKSMKLYNG
ncbi:MAG: hypothetical protein K0R54_5507, partial [Clostridiaceae bacterium]|nr:hypothetical protein [Clostridiaceae bacterium]